MTRKQLFVPAALAALMVSSIAAPVSAGLVQIKLLGPSGSIQTLTLFVPENCGRTEWPSYVVECTDVDPDYQPPAKPPVHLVRSPSGRMFNLAEIHANGDTFNGGGGGVRRHTDDIEQLGATIGGGSNIGIGTDDEGRVDVVLIDFKSQASWNKFKSGEESPEVSATWTSVKARYGN